MVLTLSHPGVRHEKVVRGLRTIVEQKFAILSQDQNLLDNTRNLLRAVNSADGARINL